MSKLPHIVLFNPDQWRSDVMGHLGNPAAVTPNLDQLAEEEAVSFRNAYCQNTVCTPSRCSFMTGWYPHVRGHRTMTHMLRSEEGDPNLLRILRDNGYLIWWGGKNDLVPGQHGYEDVADVYFRASKEQRTRWGYATRPSSHVGEQSWRGDPDGDDYYSFMWGRLDTEGEDIYFDFDWYMVLGAIDLINEYDGDKPLMIYLPIGYPHPPYGVEEPWYSITDRSALPPRVPTPDWKAKASILGGIAGKQRLQGWSEERWTELRAAYYGMCSRVDHQLGMLRTALCERGLWDDTALFFFSDHGDYTGDYGLVEKTQNTFEDCLSRVPFLVKPPKDRPVEPRVSDALVELVDFSATVFDLTGIEPGYSSFGKSLLPLLAGETDEHRDAVFCEGGRLYGEVHASEVNLMQENGLYYPRQQLQASDEGSWHGKAAMCRMGSIKYVKRLYESDELYDLSKDPREVQNLIDDPAYREVLVQLRERLLRWYMETCDVVPWDYDQRW